MRLNSKRARSGLPALVPFTTVNLFSRIFNIDFYFFFYDTASQFVFGLGRGFSEALQNNIMLTFGALASFLFYFLVFSRKKRVFIIAPLILYQL